MTRDNVTHPDHYTWHPAVECIAVTQWFNFNLGNVIKYVWRAGKKDSATQLEDLRKARQYLDFEIGRIEGGKALPEVEHEGWVTAMNRCGTMLAHGVPVLGHVGAVPHSGHTYGIGNSQWCDGYV